MIPESIAAIPSKMREWYHSLQKIKKVHLIEREFIALSMLERMRLTCYVLPQGKHSTFVGSPM